MKMMKKVDTLLAYVSIALFLSLLLIVVIQIVSRYFPFDFIWTEELSRYLFVYSMVTAAPLALRKQEFIRIDMLILALPEKVQKIYEGIIALVILLFSIVLFIYGIHLTQLGADFYAPTLGIPMTYAYSAVPLLGLLFMIYSVVYVVDRYQATVDEKGDD
ncbi:TRAP transporter small permease [Shouchella miscanthi]|uniref:TRAP transporter small permease n=1 Tax=Shouchella miscanthi TaxID=2598861 RepID=A0ABU6NKF2_9BACI|nr:TRAP transporter small permease [Shouchella miscanthi]MED4128698.1 TRAP transporter small permease [Shouchella miscanthi]